MEPPPPSTSPHSPSAPHFHSHSPSAVPAPAVSYHQHAQQPRYAPVPVHSGHAPPALPAQHLGYLPPQHQHQHPSYAPHPGYPIPPHLMGLPPSMDPSLDYGFYTYLPNEVKHRKRTTRSQKKLLESTFETDQKPNAILRKTLASQLGMTPRNVQVWFQNRRAKDKNLAKKKAKELEIAATSSGLQDGIQKKSDQPAEVEASQEKEPSSPIEKTAPLSSTPEPVVDSPSPAESQTTVAPTDFHGQRRSSAPTLLSPGLSHAKPPTQHSPTEDADIASFRRGSLPAFVGAPATIVNPPVHDPMGRRRSLEPSHHRLAAHPYASKVAGLGGGTYRGPQRSPSSGRGFLAPIVPPLAPMAPPPERRPGLAHRASLPHALRPVAFSNVGHGLPPHAYGAPHSAGPVPNGHQESFGLPALPSRLPYTFPPRVVSDPIPGPLPVAGYSFGTSSASAQPSMPYEQEEDQSPFRYTVPRKHDESDYDDDSASTSFGQVSRFGSFASIAGSDTTGTSISFATDTFPEVPSVEAEAPPAGFIPEQRRASCPAQFLNKFSGLGVTSPTTDGYAHGYRQRPSPLHGYTSPAALPVVSDEAAHISDAEGSLMFPSPPADSLSPFSPTSEGSTRTRTRSELEFALHGKHSEASPSYQPSLAGSTPPSSGSIADSQANNQEHTTPSTNAANSISAPDGVYGIASAGGGMNIGIGMGMDSGISPYALSASSSVSSLCLPVNPTNTTTPTNSNSSMAYQNIPTEFPAVPNVHAHHANQSLPYVEGEVTDTLGHLPTASSYMTSVCEPVSSLTQAMPAPVEIGLNTFNYFS